MRTDYTASLQNMLKNDSRYGIIKPIAAFFVERKRRMQKYDAIYCRQSVDRVDSISIESQIEYCRYEIKGGRLKTFTDKGFSGKNTDRPQFQAMMEAIRRGEVNRVIVYKLDRISRSVMDFMNLFTEFQNYGVEFVSCTEKFDTSSPMGRAMLKIIVVFAELERETIQQRVMDAYISRSRKGFYMGGRIPYGYRLEPYMIDGKKTAHYAVIPEEAEIVKLIFALYAQPQTSYGDIVRYLVKNNIVNSRAHDGAWDRCRIADMIKNPVYVKADLDLYRFYKDQGAILHNSPKDYIGTYGCYLYSEKDLGDKRCHLEGQHVVLAPHDGIIPSDVWLKARVKCLNNKQAARPLKGNNTWLIGKLKCGKCGYALTIRKCKLKTRTIRYFICSHRMQTAQCEGVGGIKAADFENFILREMEEHVKRFEVRSQPQSRPENPRIHEINVKIEQINQEIEKILDKVANANDVLMAYINKKIAELDSKAGAYRQELAELSSLENIGMRNINQLKDYMQYWDELEFDDKRAVVDQLIGKIKATENTCEITWRF